MDAIANIADKVIEPFRELDLKHAIRLVMIIGGYWFFRQAAQRYLAQRQLNQQVTQDRLDQSKKRAEELVDDPEAEDITATGTEAKWGWGKKTRKNVKRQEKILQETLENLHSATPDDDKDIADLLED